MATKEREWEPPTTEEEWDAVMNANVRGTFFGVQEAVKLMKKAGGGSIVALSSVHSHGAIPGRVAYSSSKGAINAMMRCFAVELGHLSIRANSIIAGAIWSERWTTQSPEETERRRRQYPAGRESSPDEIAAAVYFLCSDQSPTVTGTEFTVDSGIGICLLPYNKDWNKENEASEEAIQ
ncbi:MAG: SDR family oxidoreductase [Eubacteriales bacterium]|nr:SDR family oxidoreductase [Eubacteriales bacterium]